MGDYAGNWLNIEPMSYHPSLCEPAHFQASVSMSVSFHINSTYLKWVVKGIKWKMHTENIQ